MTPNRTHLSIALLAAIGFASPAFAQDQGEQTDAWHSAEEATEAADDASADALAAQSAAVGAEIVADHPLTGTAAEISADVATANANQAAAAANVATGAAMVAQDAAHDAAVGERQNRFAADTAEAAADTAEAASALAADAAGDAMVANSVAATAAVRAMSDPQVTVVQVPPARDGMVEPEVTITDSPGNSVSSNYHVDFAAMDTNDDGVIVRSEARGNADLMREFHVVDRDDNGRLTAVEMQDWTNPLDVATR